MCYIQHELLQVYQRLTKILHRDNDIIITTLVTLGSDLDCNLPIKISQSMEPVLRDLCTDLSDGLIKYVAIV